MRPAMSGLSGKPGIIGAVTYVRYVPMTDMPCNFSWRENWTTRIFQKTGNVSEYVRF
jgi:hypothetical protein